MSTDSWCKSQDLVGDGTKFKAYATLLHMLHHVRMLGQRKPVPDSLRFQQECIDKVPVGIGSHVQCLTTVKEERYLHAFTGAIFLKPQEFRNEVFDGSSLCFFANKVETYTAVSKSSLRKTSMGQGRSFLPAIHSGHNFLKARHSVRAPSICSGANDRGVQ